MKPLARILLLLSLSLSFAAPARAESDVTLAPGTALPPAAREVDIDEHLGRPLDKALRFTDAQSKGVQLGEYLSDGKPVVLVLAYYQCPMLCGLVLKGLTDELKHVGLDLGEQYRALTISFDPRDRPEAARQKQASTLSGLGQPDRATAWPFLVSDETESQALADALGFRFAYDPRTDQYAHPAVVFVLTPDGRISRYLYGVSFPARDLRLALVEASQGKIGTIVDRVLLTCYRYDPATRRYGPYILGFIRIGALAILIIITAMLGIFWRGERRRQKEARLS